VNAPSSSPWQTALAFSEIGAAHRRRGLPCQDSSLSCWLTAPDGQHLQLLAVADGHGGRRYRLSHVGSALAVQLARQAVEQALQDTPLEDIKSWRDALQQRLPTTVHRSWLAATQAHWEELAEAGQEPFTAASYGTTLGLLLLAPQWWGVTGLGDWDLVGIDHEGTAQLLNEESSDAAVGEATASLCLNTMVDHCRQRAGVQEYGTAPLEALLLSTDGIRKSCATDLDFLTLCAQVITIRTLPKLQQTLAQISADGSGDDVSLALVRLGGEHVVRVQPKILSRKQFTRTRLVVVGLLSTGFITTSALLLTQPTPNPLSQRKSSDHSISVAPIGSLLPLWPQPQRLCPHPQPLPCTKDFSAIEISFDDPLVSSLRTHPHVECIRCVLIGGPRFDPLFTIEGHSIRHCDFWRQSCFLPCAISILTARSQYLASALPLCSNNLEKFCRLLKEPLGNETSKRVQACDLLGMNNFWGI